MEDNLIAVNELYYDDPLNGVVKPLSCSSVSDCKQGMLKNSIETHETSRFVVMIIEWMGPCLVGLDWLSIRSELQMLETSTSFVRGVKVETRLILLRNWLWAQRLRNLARNCGNFGISAKVLFLAKKSSSNLLKYVRIRTLASSHHFFTASTPTRCQTEGLIGFKWG